MKLHLSALLITMGLWSCTQNLTFEEASNTKLQSAIKYNDSVLINSIDFFDIGYADSIVATYGVSIQKKDSVHYLLWSDKDSTIFGRIRAYQGNTYTDILTQRISKDAPLSTHGLAMSEDGKTLFSDTSVIAYIMQDNRLVGVFPIERELSLATLISDQKAKSFLRVFAESNHQVCPDLLIPLRNGKPLKDPNLVGREDLHGNIMYFAFLDRYKDGNTENNRKVENPLVTERTNYHGGDMKGLEDVIKSGYLNDLGVNSVWISPITKNPDGAWGNFKDPHVMFSGYHGYWPSLSTVIDDRVGNEKELNSLLKTAHDSNMNVLLDYVAHHVHKEHPIYKLHPDWVTPLYLPDGSLNTERWDDHRLTTWFDTFMPTLDLGRPEIADYMVDSALFWLKAFDFDGFRHDATKHIPLNFTRLLTKKIREQVAAEKGKNMYQIGETYGDPDLISSYVESGLLDAQFDFNLYDRMVDVFAFNDPMEKLVNEQKRSLKVYGYHHLMGNITGNQDRARFISFADQTIDRSTDWIELKRIGHLQTLTAKPLGFERFKCFYAYQMTAPGIPVIYYGDEIGMPGGNDPGNRSPMKFEGLNNNESSLKSWVKHLTGLRRNSLALMYGDFDILHYTENAIVIRRSYLGETVIVMINKGDLNFLWHGQNAFESYGELKQSLSSRNSDVQRFEVGPNSALVLQFIQK